MDKEQEKKNPVWVKVLNKAADKVDWFNPYDKRHCVGFLVTIAVVAGAAGWYGFKKEEKKK